MSRKIPAVLSWAVKSRQNNKEKLAVGELNVEDEQKSEGKHEVERKKCRINTVPVIILPKFKETSNWMQALREVRYVENVNGN